MNVVPSFLSFRKQADLFLGWHRLHVQRFSFADAVHVLPVGIPGKFRIEAGDQGSGFFRVVFQQMIHGQSEHLGGDDISQLLVHRLHAGIVQYAAISAGFELQQRHEIGQITEIGGTVGDIESLPFLEAMAPARMARSNFSLASMKAGMLLARTEYSIVTVSAMTFIAVPPREMNP